MPPVCRSWLAGEGLECAAFILLKRVIVDVFRWQASSYREFGVRTLFTYRRNGYVHLKKNGQLPGRLREQAHSHILSGG
jgi:hypothetical protein